MGNWGYISTKLQKTHPCAETRHTTYWSSKSVHVLPILTIYRPTRNPMNNVKRRVDYDTKTRDKWRVHPDHPRCRSVTWICICGHANDVVLYSKFNRNPFRGFGASGGSKYQICPFTLLWLLAFTTACTNVKAVSSRDAWSSTWTGAITTDVTCDTVMRGCVINSCHQQQSVYTSVVATTGLGLTEVVSDQ